MGTTLYSHEKYVRPVLIKVTEQEAIWYLREAYKDLFGDYPSNEAMACLYAQVMLETGRFKIGCYCANYGNIKKVFSPDDGHLFTMFATGENLLDPKLGKVVYKWFQPPDPQTAFRAYNTLREGAVDYITFLSKKKRYVTAWKALQEGNPTQYSHELKVGGYYTADEGKYTKGVVSLFNEYMKRKEEFLSWQPAPERANPSEVLGPDTTELPTSPSASVPEPLAPIPDSPAAPEQPKVAYNPTIAIVLFIAGIATFISTFFQNCK